MAALVGAADIYITPYRYEAQAVSELWRMLGRREAIISTLLARSRTAGRWTRTLVPFEDPDAIATAAIELLDNDGQRQAMRQRAYMYGGTWSGTGCAVLHAHLHTGSRQSIQPALLRFPAQLWRRSLQASS